MFDVHKCRLGGWLGLGSLLAVMGWAPDAEACSQPLPGWYASLGTPQVPSDGLAIIAFSCFSSCEEFDATITVREALTGAEVPGTLAPLPDVPATLNLYGWRPASPLTAGALYQVELPGPGGPSTQELAAVAPTIPDPETFTVTPLTEIVEYGAGEDVCCPGGPVNSCGTGHCYYPRIRKGLSILLDWSTTPELPHWSQYVSRVTWDGQAPAAEWANNPRASFDTEQAEYCYTIELKSIIDGSTLQFERSCVPHPAGETLGETDQDPALVRNQLAVCDQPPAGLENDWCAARAERCTLFPYDQCEAPLATYCDSSGGTGGTTGSGGSSGTGGGVTAGNAGTGGDVAGNGADGSDGGCSAAPAGSARSTGLAAWAVALSALVLARRRRALASPR